MNKNFLKNVFPLTCIVAVSSDKIIGDGEKLLWHIPEDLKRLKLMTMGNPLIMGRKTFESIGRPLPGRANIVITRNQNFKSEGAYIVNSLDSAIEKSNSWIYENFNNREIKSKKIFLFGGGQIYNLALKFCRSIEMTIVDIVVGKGIKFPNINENEWSKQLKQKKKSKQKNLHFSYWTFTRK